MAAGDAMCSTVLGVSKVVFKYFIWMLHILQWLYTHVASISFKCFSYFRCMFRVFHLDVAEVYLDVA
jgi:hypothetical protein